VFVVFQDPETRTLVFYTSCNPFSTNPYGGQPLRHASGRLEAAAAHHDARPRGGRGRRGDGGAPGPFGYSARLVSR